MLIGALAFSTVACTKTTKVGGPGATDYVAPTKSKSPKPEKTKTQQPTTSAPPQTVKPPPGVEPKDREVSALNNNVYDTYDVQARKGDTLIFYNKASDFQHTFTIDDSDIDSGPVVGPSGKYKVVVDLANGVYNYKCTLVPYMVGGQLTVY